MKPYNKGAVLAIAGSALVSTLAVGATFAPSTLAAFTDSSSSTANTATAGTLNIDVVDGAGNVSTAATVSVTNASPTMAPRTYTLSLKNSGSLDSSLRVHTKITSASTVSLDDVLRVQVLDPLGTIIYTGKVSGLDLTVPNLKSTATSLYTIKITWPDGGATDNPYQGATMTFDLTADASVIAGQ